jgi:hypothetical protein
MTFNKLNTILAITIFLGVVTSLCTVTTMNSYKDNNLGTNISKFLIENN